MVRKMEKVGHIWLFLFLDIWNNGAGYNLFPRDRNVGCITERRRGKFDRNHNQETSEWKILERWHTWVNTHLSNFQVNFVKPGCLAKSDISQHQIFHEYMFLHNSGTYET